MSSSLHYKAPHAFQRLSILWTSLYRELRLLFPFYKSFSSVSIRKFQLLPWRVETFLAKFRAFTTLFFIVLGDESIIFIMFVSEYQPTAGNPSSISVSTIVRAHLVCLDGLLFVETISRLYNFKLISNGPAAPSWIRDCLALVDITSVWGLHVLIQSWWLLNTASIWI